MDTKKISFGFSKVAKKPNILPSKVQKEENKVELIKCLEGKEIRLVTEKQETAPLVIQLPTSQKTSTALASLMKRRAVLLGEDDVEPEESTIEPQSIAEVTVNSERANLEQRAARELIAAALANGNEIVDGEMLVLPALKADELPLDGAKEATLDDYDSIPIDKFGLAMLRGMGWVDPPPKKKGAAPVDEAPFLRPKGMGLGADKALKPKALLVQPDKNEVLEIKKQAFVRILGGKQKDQYGQIEGFDDHAGRVIVKMAIGGAKEAFNEFLCQPVSRKEYSQYGKCINTAKYEEFKKLENEHGQIIIKREKSTERTSVKTERRERQREEERRLHATKDEERKPYKKEHRSVKPEERRTESRDYKEECSTSYRRGEHKPYKAEERGKDESSSSSRYHEHGQDSLPSSSTSKSSSRRRQQSSSDEAEDTGESTESDSDSAYERKNKKSKSGSSRNKSKKRKSKKTKGKSHRQHRSSISSEDSDNSADERARRRHQSKHKKKTKKSKHARSRTRSRSREGRAR
ncbi:G-patch domain and KOW motifs-containing protein isoform X1 [Drosophila montana]|uniref:G-patch domain and KOW motifs-containing protein isoform X1 n=1 Tax=Drosophila montana TaxID=40370 RepID=UPI00313B3CC6